MIIEIKVKDFGVIIAKLEKDIAPKTVSNFVRLIKKHYYDGLIFHRVIPGFMIQGGCPLGTGTGGPGHQIVGEFLANGFNNPLKHTRGVLSMARSMDPNSAGSQFFIVQEDAPHLDGYYASFGSVIEGLDVVDTITRQKTNEIDKPLNDVIIEYIRIKEGEI